MPIGFAVDQRSDDGFERTRLRWFAGQNSQQPWVGLNCATCHTGIVEYKGRLHRIDGAPSLFDYQSFIEGLDKALHQTLASAEASDSLGQARFRSFARNVLSSQQTPAASDTPENRDLLRKALAKLVAWEDTVEHMNATVSRYGYGRVDAFGHIFNKVALFVGAPSPTPSAASAPVSYPFLWDIHRQDFLQWNGIAQKARISLGGNREFDFGALGRNTGEVLGVFGDINVPKEYPGIKGYRSSVDVANLERIERLLTKLKAPAWPTELGQAGTPEQLAKGKALFARECENCHKPQPGTEPYKVTFVAQTYGNPNNTDGWMACNAIRYTSSTGNFAGVPENYLGGNEKYNSLTAPLASMLGTMVKGALANQKLEIATQIGRVFLGFGALPKVVPKITMMIPVDQELSRCYKSNNPLMRYKARPLDGIWATAPYLHNGSVPNLYQLLLPDSLRTKTFYVGTRRFDSEYVGFETAETAPGNGFLFDTRLKGNSNKGHNYGNSSGRLMTEADRAALIAFMKTM